MKTTTFVLACTLLGFALIAAPFEPLSIAPTASASTCLPSDDPVRDVQCHTRCVPKSVDEVLNPRACPL